MAKTKHSVGIESFVQAWMNQVIKGGNITELASELNQKPTSVYQRSIKVSKTLVEKGLTKLPPLPLSTPKERTIDLTRIAELLNQSRSQQTS